MTTDTQLIKSTRFRLGWTQKQLAERANVAVKTIVNAEGGKNITPAVNRAILDALGLK